MNSADRQNSGPATLLTYQTSNIGRTLAEAYQTSDARWLKRDMKRNSCSHQQNRYRTAFPKSVGLAAPGHSAQVLHCRRSALVALLPVALGLRFVGLARVCFFVSPPSVSPSSAP